MMMMMTMTMMVTATTRPIIINDDHDGDVDNHTHSDNVISGFNVFAFASSLFQCVSHNRKQISLDLLRTMPSNVNFDSGTAQGVS